MAVPHSPLAPVDLDHPIPWKVCDRCGKRRLEGDVAWQHDWVGMELKNLGILVCSDTCLDEPQPNGRKPIIIGPDPVPVRDPRPGFAAQQMAGTGIVGAVTINLVTLIDD